MQGGRIILEKKEKVAFITLDRPDKRNALSTELVHALRHAWIDFDSDPDLRVAILTGSGNVFCSGVDLTEANVGAPSCIPNYGIEVTKPVIVAINGPAIGVGMMLANACDIKVMAENASLSFPEGKIGFAPGGVDLLRYVPYAVAMEVWLTGEPLDAGRCYQLGIVNRVVTGEQLMGEAIRFADIIKENAPLALKMLKMMAVRHTLSVESEWLMTEDRYIKPQLASQDFKEGVRAFKEKRKPVFKGK